MNNLAFIQKLIEAYKISSDNAFKIYSDNSKIVVNINGQTWAEDTLDQCCASIKQSLAIQRLELIEMQNNK